MLRAVLFDFNGVLVDDEPIHQQLFERVLEEEGIELAADRDSGRFLGRDDKACFTELLAASGRPAEPDKVARLIARKAAYYRERIRRDGYRFFPGALDLVRAAAAAGLSLGVVSGALRDEVVEALRQAGIEGCFKVLVTAEDVAEGKPDAAGYRHAIEQLNALPPRPVRLYHPHEALAVEDSPAGLAAAAGAGLTTLAVAHSYPAPRLRSAGRVLPSLVGVGVDELTAIYDAIAGVA